MTAQCRCRRRPMIKNEPERVRLDLFSLRLALTIADHRSLRRAAKAVGLSESSLSHRLRSLEDGLTLGLFHRSSEGVTPTNAGRQFFARSREALRILDLAIAEAAESSRGMAGKVAIGLYTSLSTGRLRDAVLQFGREHAEIDLQLIEGSRSRMIEGLSARTLDVAVLIGTPEPTLGEAVMLWTEQAYVIVLSTHPIARHDEVDWSRLADERLVFSTRDAGPEAESAFIARSGGPGRQPNRDLHNVNRDTLLTLVAMGRGIALMIESDLGYLPPGVVAIPLAQGGRRTREVLTAYRDPGNDNPALRRFWSLLKSHYSDIE